MITAHQPTIFANFHVLAAVSSLDDGSMRLQPNGDGTDDAEIVQNRRRFLNKLSIDIDQTVLVYVTYDNDTFTRFRTTDSSVAGVGMQVAGSAQPADGLATKERNVPLFLPLADCNGVILYDSTTHTLMVVHLGRHSTVQDGAKKAIEFMVAQYDTDPADVYAWLSPVVGKDSYKMETRPLSPHHFNFATNPAWENFRRIDGDKVYIDIAGYNRNGMLQAGMKAEHIEVCDVDTATDSQYPSHSSGDSDRYAIVAMLR